LNKKRIVLLVVIVLFIITFAAQIVMDDKYDGSTPESRQKIIARNIEGAVICEELMIDGLMISGYTYPGENYGIAVFTEEGNGEYKFQSKFTRDKNNVIIAYAYLPDKTYNIFWANKPDMDFAEITYTAEVNGEDVTEIVTLDASDNKIIYHELKYNDVTINAVFYDVYGNVYE